MKKHPEELLELLREDILDRYDNSEYWNEDIIDSFYSDYVEDLKRGDEE